MNLSREPRSVAVRMSFLLAASLAIAACGGSEDAVVDASAQVDATTSTVELATTESTTATTAAATTAAPTTAAPTTEAPTTQPPAPASQVPDIAVTNVSTGDSVSLRSIAGTGTPVALWFWFPH